MFDGAEDCGSVGYSEELDTLAACDVCVADVGEEGWD